MEGCTINSSIVDVMDERLIKKIERQYAYFHRVLSGLLVDLAAQPETVWLSGREHFLAEDYQDNRYERALYPVQDFGLFTERFAELAAVQTEAVAILGVKKVPIGLLTPQVLDDVHFARLTRQDNYRVKWLSKAEVLGRYQGKLNQALAAFEAFRSQSWGLGDQGLKTVENEVRTLEHGLRRLEACDDDRFREHFRFERVIVTVYATGSPTKHLHVRNVGMVLVGPKVQLAWADGVRQGRSDKVELTPLLTLGPLEVYSAKAWSEVAERVRS